MVFSSMVFLWIFLPIVLIGSRILPKKFVNLFLLIASLFFYSWGEPIYVFLMLISILINYTISILMDKYIAKHDKTPPRFYLIIALIFNLGMLIYFKYYNFIGENLYALINKIVFFKEEISLITSGFYISSGESWLWTHSDIALPIGISFYTFQTLSYVIDVYRRKVKAEKNIINLGLYISFFPQLIAGPIVKFIDIQRQLSEREVTNTKTFEGIRRFVLGLSKKVLIANSCAYIADIVFNSDYSSVGALTGWLGIICYTFQIYYDFSGYSDMAIGLGKMFGFDFCENFNYPYISKSIQEFWRRWHISLSSWFREYLYIPLGGNRKGKVRTYVNLFIVFLCTGMWHGASWNFVLWGLWHGLFMILERIYLGKILEKNRFKIINHVYSLAVIMFGWILFRAENIGLAMDYFVNMFKFNNFHTEYISIAKYVNPQLILILILAVIFCGIFRYSEREKSPYEMSSKRLCVESVAIIGLLGINILALAASTYNPFIYFRF